MPQLIAEAKKKSLANLNSQQDSPKVSYETVDRPDNNRSRNQAAKIAEVAPSSIQRAWEVTKADPALAEVARKNKISPWTASRALKDPELRKELLAGKNHGAKPKKERVAQISNLANKGYHDTQIAREIGISAKAVRRLAIEAGISLTKQRRVDVNRVLQETVATGESLASTIELLDGKLQDIDVSKLSGWIESLEHSRRTLGKLIRLLKGVPQ